jgi:amidohydrolase
MKARIVSSMSFALALVSASSISAQQKAGIQTEVQTAYAQSEILYRDLHAHPELSSFETQTAAKLATQLQQLGYEVTTGIGGTGVVAILKNGAGLTVMLRTELDALPVAENTGLSFASTVHTKDAAGLDVSVMHACGHDLHMASWMGTARIMAGSRSSWKGTLMLLAQPAEETGAGAKAMIADGLFTKFAKPDFAIAVHDDARTLAGTVGFHAGPVLSNADAVTVHIYGRGGHGARPESTVDPIVIAAKTILSFQTIVSREMSPFDPSVITVGAIHGGTKNNVIPDEVTLLLTVRSFTTPVRQHLLASIKRIANAEAMAAGAPKEPLIEVYQTAQALVNDPVLTKRVSAALVREFGVSKAMDVPPEMVSEDFSEFSLAGVPTLQLRIGAVEPAKYEAAAKGGPPLPSLHSSTFFPDLEPTMKSAMGAEVVALRELMPVTRK